MELLFFFKLIFDLLEFLRNRFHDSFQASFETIFVDRYLEFLIQVLLVSREFSQAVTIVFIPDQRSFVVLSLLVSRIAFELRLWLGEQKLFVFFMWRFYRDLYVVTFQRYSLQDMLKLMLGLILVVLVFDYLLRLLAFAAAIA